MILENVLLLLLIKLLHRVYLRKREEVERKELLLSPYLTIVVGYWFLSFMMNAYEKDLGEYIWNRHGWYAWMDTMFQIAVFLTILATVMSYERINLSREDKLHKRLLNEQVKELTIDEESGLPETSRNAEDGHGYGLQNVKKAVERYYGAVNIVQEGNEWLQDGHP